MPVTLTPRQIGWGALALALLLVLRYLGRPREEVETVTPEHPLVIDVPRLQVVAGRDTVIVMGPALFTYVGLDPEDADPPPRLLEAARQLQDAVSDAGAGLEALGVRVLSVVEPPVPLGLPPEVWAAAGPRLERGGMGLLLADPQGRVLRMDRVAGGAALVCAAARTFGRTPPADVSSSCR